MEYLDLFGDPVKVYINGKEKIKTSLGGFLTILMFLVVCTFSWIIGKDVLYKENPFSFTQNSYYTDYPDILVNYDTFPIAFALLDNNSLPVYNESLYKMDLYYYRYDVVDGEFALSDLISINLQMCNYQDYPWPISEETFNSYGMNMYMCADKLNITLSGYWAENHVYFLKLDLHFCREGNGVVCASDSEIAQKIAEYGLNINLFYFNSIANVKNFSQPFEKIFQNPYKWINPDLMKISNYMIMTNQLSTDSGFFFPSWEETKFYEMIELQTDISALDKNVKSLANLSIYSHNNYSNYYRQYIKVPEILASVGGLIRIASLVIVMINFQISRINKFQILSNEIFIIPKENSKIPLNIRSNNLVTPVILNNTQGPSLDIKNMSDIAFKNNNFLKQEELSTLSFNLEEKIRFRFENINHKSKNKLYLTATDKCKILFKRKTKSNSMKLWEKAQMKIKHYFDFAHIIKIFEEFHKLKDIILNDYQKSLFEFISKPLLDGEEELYKDEFVAQNILEKVKKLTEGLETNSNNEIDTNLFQLINNI